MYVLSAEHVTYGATPVLSVARQERPIVGTCYAERFWENRIH
ncbi:MAG: hypothetical protein AAGA56_24805 [Myxococcota bacterium]